jgi:hypothetical protein
MQVKELVHVPAIFTLGKALPLSIVPETAWIAEQFKEQIYHLPLSEIEPQFFGYSAHGLVTLPTKLP